MKSKKKLLYTIIAGCTTMILSGCTESLEDIVSTGVPKGCIAQADISLGALAEVETRYNKDSYDQWSVSSFSSGDKVGMYSLSGRQNDDDESLFELPVVNEPMYFEGKLGNYYRFNNPDIILDPLTVNASYSKMYRPYYPKMPSTTDPASLPGIPLREWHDNIEKCIDFMYSSGDKISLLNGGLQPTFYHYFGVLGIQRGEGFQKAPDKRVWIITQNPYTDIRIKQSSATNYFSYTLQYLPEEEGDDLMTEIVPERPDLVVNKYRLWEAWEGNMYKNLQTFYAIVPPGNVTYILIQDDYGNWQSITDFYLYSTTSKTINSNYRYMLKVEIEGVSVVVRPVLVEPWNEEVSITDDRKVGIQSIEEFTTWVSLYNLYIEKGRPEDMEDRLRRYGDGVKTGEDGPVAWTFYINSHLNLDGEEGYVIERLEDVVEGSSQYTNYSIKNLRHTLINEIAEGGEIRSLDFEELYVISTTESSSDGFCGGIAGKISGGKVKGCNIRNGIIVTDRSVGIIAGSITSGEVLDCIVSGDVIGISTADGYSGMFGTVTGNPKIENNNFRDLNFINYQ